MSPNAQRYIDYIRAAIAKIQAYTAAGEEAFQADTRTQEAVLFNIEYFANAHNRSRERHLPQT